MKTCSKCSVPQPLENFGKKNNGHQPYCRPCMREHNRAYYAANRDVQKERVKARSKRYREELRKLIRSLKEASPCLDCNVSYPWYVMDYDHVTGNKEYDVSVMVANLASKQRILDEIAKCELVCSNCHRERTFSRAATVGPLLWDNSD